MRLGDPRCSGPAGRPHPLERRRLEVVESLVILLRCPTCWAAHPLVELETLDRLLEHDQVAALMSREVADELRVASPPVRIQVEPTDDERIVEIVASRVEEVPL
jgi:hypothetical protein